MRKYSIPLFFALVVMIATSCSYFLSSYDGPITVSHGFVQGVSPSNSEIYEQRSYQTIKANWPGPGGNKLWLAVNLGAVDDPNSSVDSNPEHAGWKFQFNKRQAYHHNGNVLVPHWKHSSINEDSEWEPINDPCRILLGDPWRIPTIEEIRAFRQAPQNRGGMSEGNRTDAFNSALRLHAAGELASFDGQLRLRGENGRYWSRDQFSPTHGEAFGFNTEGSGTFGSNKAFGRPVRCIRD